MIKIAATNNEVIKAVTEEALRFIESEEMREYLRSIDMKLWVSQYGKVIARSRAPLIEKASSFKRIAGIIRRYTGQREFALPFKYPAKLAKAAFAAMDETTENIPAGAVFLLRESDRTKYERLPLTAEEDTPFTSFEAAMHGLLNTDKFMYEMAGADDRLLFFIEKWVPAENGKMRGIVWFTVSAGGEIWFCDVFDENMDIHLATLKEAEFTLGYGGDELNLPVPFQIGDIITMDCRPYNGVFHGVIAEIGDNRDCCAVQCFYINEAGRLGVNALKHNCLIGGRLSPLSPLLRAACFKGELPEREAPLKIISDALKRNPSLGRSYQNYMDAIEDTMINSGSYDCLGVEWEDFRRAYAL